MGNCLCHFILQYAGETSGRIDIVYVYHVFVASHLIGVHVGIFIDENGEVLLFYKKLQHICLKLYT